jgi:hypothetical protein
MLVRVGFMYITRRTSTNVVFSHEFDQLNGLLPSFLATLGSVRAKNLTRHPTRRWEVRSGQHPCHIPHLACCGIGKEASDSNGINELAPCLELSLKHGGAHRLVKKGHSADSISCRSSQLAIPRTILVRALTFSFKSAPGEWFGPGGLDGESLLHL